MAGILSKGIQLSYKVGESASYTLLTNLQEIPELGGTAEKVETTTLENASKTYIKGLIDYGDLSFKFLYDPAQFKTLSGLSGFVNWQVGLPDGENGAISTLATFTGEPNIKLDGVGTNTPMTYTLDIALNSEIAFN